MSLRPLHSQVTEPKWELMGLGNLSALPLAQVSSKRRIQWLDLTLGNLDWERGAWDRYGVAVSLNGEISAS